MDIQVHDDIQFKFINDSQLEVYEYETENPDDGIIESWKAGDIEEATVIDIPNNNCTHLTIQFPDSSVTFLPLSFVEILKINEEPQK
jgi:hypothetical protein